MKVQFSVKEVYKLSSDYKNIFINNTANFTPEYDLVQLSSRTVNKSHYDDIFILEPNSYYRIDFNEKHLLSKGIVNTIDFDSILIDSGLILQYDYKKPCLYVFNANQNMIYLQKGAILLKIEV